ncbi:MAG TPA: TlpA disulfide reductase family protein [Nitrospirota bacterium]
MKKVTIILVLVIAALIECTSNNNKSGHSTSTTTDFTLEDINGHPVSLSDYKGKVVVLEFWATWCPPCRASVPGLIKLNTAYKDKGLVVLAVSMDEGGWDDVKSFVRQNGINYSVLKGTEDVAVQYQVRTIPMLLVLNKEGKISKQYLGFGNDEELEKDIKAYL